MKKIKVAALCLSAAITLSTITVPAFASTEINRPSGFDAKEKMIVSKAKPDITKDKGAKEKKYNFKFSDSKNYIDNMEWAIKAIEKLGAKGIISGYSDKSYKPQNKVTNMEALSLILKLTNREEKIKNYGDTKSLFNEYQKQWNLKWGWGYIYVAVDEGILLPEELKDFNPGKPIKRHEVAKYLIRAIGQTKEALNNMDSQLSYKDKEAIPKTSWGYVYMANKLGIMTGSNNQFMPNEPLTRAEIAVLIDKADNYFNNDEGENDTKVVFSSFDDKNSRLYVKDNGESTYYNAIENVIVYKNNIYTDIDDLVQGDVLEVVFNSSKQVIFIEVVKQQADQDSDSSREEIKYTVMNYNDLPAGIKSQVDTLRATKGYKAYKYENKIYLAVFMGKKNSGGYSVEIDDLYKYGLGNGKYKVEAVVEESIPESGSNVIQAITYPYTVMSFDSFDTIERINFVDDDGDVLAQRNIENLNNESTVSGTLFYIGNDFSYIKISKDNKIIKYDMAEAVEVDVNDKEATIADLKLNMSVNLTLLNDEVIKISADNEVKEIKGIIQYVDNTKKEIRVKYNNKHFTYYIEDNTEITLNDKDAKFSELKPGMEVELQLANNRIVCVDAVDVIETFEGKIKDLKIINNKLKEIVIMVDGLQKKYEITDNTKAIMLDGTSQKESLAINSIVEIKLLNGELIEIKEK